MQTLFTRVKTGLGRSVNLTVTSELYKLFLCEPGKVINFIWTHSLDSM